jgi:membrane fusion protein (multidrug efflux system)
VTRPPRPRAWLAFSALAGLALLAQGCSPSDGRTADDPEDEAEEQALAVRVAPVERAAMSSLYSSSTTLRPERQATVTARTKGVVEKLLVEEGTRVEEGQALAVLEDDEQRIAAAKATAARDTTAREAARAQDLHAQGLLAEEPRDAAERKAAEAAREADLAALTHARTIVRAPFTGQVLKRHLDVGATVSDGTAVYDVGDLDPLVADVNVPERHLSRLAPGQSVRLLADASGTLVDARVDRVAPAVNPQTGTVKVTLAVPAHDGLRPGAFVRAQVVTETHPDALVVPRSALVAEGHRWHVFRVAADGVHAEAVGVALGFEEGDRVEILPADGATGAAARAPIAAGDRVVAAGAAALADGARIHVVEPDPPQGASGRS